MDVIMVCCYEINANIIIVLVEYIEYEYGGNIDELWIWLALLQCNGMEMYYVVLFMLYFT